MAPYNSVTNAGNYDHCTQGTADRRDTVGILTEPTPNRASSFVSHSSGFLALLASGSRKQQPVLHCHPFVSKQHQVHLR
ncbi:hypothetical protein T05_1076 [Trichinella murrelli]|uniref:Uncharacterized protein n=1 Tax=Trichinella murrelli TaxID=144512 RepID=A0A0V0T4Y3_9BILA|nr:hypothetical protein T05_1076 [Trichinella murrelli]